MYGVYSWQNNTRHKVQKFEYILQTKIVDGILGWIVFMVYDIDIHQLNLGKLRN
jgi:hypothetical protein